jgi:hypothetical protein
MVRTGKKGGSCGHDRMVELLLEILQNFYIYAQVNAWEVSSLPFIILLKELFIRAKGL